MANRNRNRDRSPKPPPPTDAALMNIRDTLPPPLTGLRVLEFAGLAPGMYSHTLYIYMYIFVCMCVCVYNYCRAIQRH